MAVVVVVVTTAEVAAATMVVEDTLEVSVLLANARVAECHCYQVEVEAIKDHLVLQLAGERTSKVEVEV